MSEADIDEYASKEESSRTETDGLTTRWKRSRAINRIIFDILTTIFLVTLTSNNVEVHAKLSEENQQVCKTPACKETANSILGKMDQSIDPCDNFYHFVCGNFTKHAVILDDRPMSSYYSTLRDKVQKELWTSIETDITVDDPRSFKLLKSLYDTCMNEDQIEATSEQEFLENLQKLGGWPVLVGESWDESTFDWKESVYRLRESGHTFNQFVDLRTANDMKNNSRKLVYLDQPKLGIAQEYLSEGLDQRIVKAYFKYMVDLAELFGAERKQAEKELAESLNFEIELAKISLPANKRRNITMLYNPITVEELENNYSGVPWYEYLNRILSPYTSIQPNQTVIVSVPNFLNNLGNLLGKTPKRVLANYAYWRLVEESASQLSERVHKLQRDFTATMTGSNKRSPRWQQCVDQVNGRMRLATGALYVRRHFDKRTKDSATEMIINIRKTFQQMLTEINWMEAKTKKAALEKLDRMIPLVAYPDEFLDDQKLDDYYNSLKVYPESYLKTSCSFNLFALANSFKRLDKPVNKTDWTTHDGAAVVNAYYRPLENTMQFLAGILQGAYFDTDHPQYMNYAGMGSFVGHEMTHGFDDRGRRFDKDGNLVDWWDPNTKNEYMNRAQCIIDQYSNYTVEEVKLRLDGVNTQGENIADNGGIKEAYLAYEAWETRNGVEPRLPGLEAYSPKQMFWISYANVWCTKYRPEFLKNAIVVDSHSPNEFRVVGPMSNRPEFSRDFNCPIGVGMNPPKKCTVW